MPKVAVGGTFQYLHDGHEVLVIKAFEIAKGEKVYIGLTSDEMINKNHKAHAYECRKTKLIEFLENLDIPDKNYIISKLNDPYGPTLDGDFDYIVVSPETYPVALKINRLREEKGLTPLKIARVEYVMAEDGIPISSTRIAEGKIDGHGRLKEKGDRGEGPE